MRTWGAVLWAVFALAGCGDHGARGALYEGEPTRDAAVGDAGPGPGQVCLPDARSCDGTRLRTCVEDGSGWLVESCGDTATCRAGACVEQACAPGSRACADDGVRTCRADGSGFDPVEACPDDRTCLDGACIRPFCSAGERVCGEGVLLTCAADGLSWGRTECAAGERCLEGKCQRLTGEGGCPAGETLCGPEGIFACNATGNGWVETPCGAGEACFQGRCVGCVRDTDCPAGQACVDDACATAPVQVVTDRLPAGQVDVPYRAELAVEGGTPPYTWTVSAGQVSAGLSVSPEGVIEGTPVAAGISRFTVTVEDDAGRQDARALALTVVEGGDLSIVTDRLPGAEEGTPYEATLEALGGQAPYGWMVTEGGLPQGLALTSDGRITGTPAEVGAFEIRLRVVDAAAPPAYAERALTLDVEVAPLEIVGDQQFDLFVTKVVVLPAITVIPDVPVPYQTQLNARGGIRPYRWAETDFPEELQRFVPSSGLPDGVTLDADGRLSGAVTDPTQIVEVTIPFVEITLTGFFFTAEVTDSQDPAATASAIFLLPTLPIGQ